VRSKNYGALDVLNFITFPVMCTESVSGFSLWILASKERAALLVFGKWHSYKRDAK
jgi:hypothetical protein